MGEGSHEGRAFQSSPVPKDGCNQVLHRCCRFGFEVSILTRPEGRVQPQPKRELLPIPKGFNPHPSRRTGATREIRGRVGARHSVSILTRPEGRVQPPHPAYWVPLKRGFNPHPSRRTGATVFSFHSFGGFPSFNPHPSRRTGATKRVCPTVFRGAHVSILTRPEGRVQREQRKLYAALLLVSILTRPEGRVQPRAAYLLHFGITFQSSPVPKDGCNAMPSSFAWSAIFSFNPHPSRRTGAT